MSKLTDRWSRLRSLPHVSLATTPTPIERSRALSELLSSDVWVKRDDLTGTRYGGNKVRKLEYLLADAMDRRADTIVTTGAAGSHHVLATSIYGRQLGLEVHGVMVPQSRSPHVEENLRADIAHGAVLHPVPFYAAVAPAMAALVASLRLRGRRPYVIGPGGSEVPGVIGYVEGGIELANQFLVSKGLEPDVIFLPLGSGGTLAGVALGLAAAGVMTKIVAVRVSPKGLVRRAWLHALVRGACERLRGLDDRFPNVADIAMANVEIDETQLGGGYGVPTGSGREAGRLAREVAGLPLDATYTEKTFAALIAAARDARRGQRLLYLHTLSSAPTEPLARGASPLPSRVASLMR
jgi:1-aminocyclopropane-1-carboxylate deaminase/D-cysteine desulfhydrase-like pyridoxal-dependent ACC family enzyme